MKSSVIEINCLILIKINVACLIYENTHRIISLSFFFLNINLQVIL
jgi:hypothetical protein